MRVKLATPECVCYARNPRCIPDGIVYSDTCKAVCITHRSRNNIVFNALSKWSSVGIVVC